MKKAGANTAIIIIAIAAVVIVAGILVYFLFIRGPVGTKEDQITTIIFNCFKPCLNMDEDEQAFILCFIGCSSKISSEYKRIFGTDYSPESLTDPSFIEKLSPANKEKLNCINACNQDSVDVTTNLQCLKSCL